MSDSLELRSSQRGLCSQYFWSLAWFLVLMRLAAWCSHRIDSIYTILRVSSYSQFTDLGSRHQDQYWTMSPLPLLHMGMILSYIIAGIVVLANLHSFFYSSRQINVLHKNGKGHWSKLICTMYDFPFDKAVKQLIFDRIVEIAVVQTGIDRALDTGSLQIKTVTFTNAGSEETERIIPAIRKPYDAKNNIETALMDHEGVTVKFQRPRAA